jgi:uncharacterized cofD-like protein
VPAPHQWADVDWVGGLDWVARLLGAAGRVLPMSTVPLNIEADVTTVVAGEGEHHATVRGQSKVASSGGRVDQVRLVPAGAPACPEAVAALRAADWIVLGPGSWFSSVIPHLLIDDLARAIANPAARRVLTLNLTEQSGETAGYTAADHLDALSRYAGPIAFDVILVDPSMAGDEARLRAKAAGLGAELLIRPVRATDGSARHDDLLLAAAFREIFDSDRRWGARRATPDGRA